MAARLTIHFGDRPTRTQIIAEPGRYVLGRDPRCDVLLDDPRVSRRHARLTVGVADGAIEDLGSKNGLVVGGLAVERAALPAASWLSIGGLAVQFETGDAAELEAGVELDQRRSTLAGHQALAEPGLGVAGLVERLLASFLQTSGTERGFVLLGTEGRFAVVASHELGPTTVEDDEFSGSVTAVRQALAGGKAVVVSDVSDLTESRPSLAREGIRALVCVPLLAAGRTMGAVYADSRLPGKGFRDLDVEILTALAAHAALALLAAGLQDDLANLTAGLPTRAIDRQPVLAPLPGYTTWSVAGGLAPGAGP